FFSNTPASTAIYTLSLHDALPIYQGTTRIAGVERGVRLDDAVDEPPRRRTQRPAECAHHPRCHRALKAVRVTDRDRQLPHPDGRSEEHTSELQSRSDLVCRLLLEK